MNRSQHNVDHSASLTEHKTYFNKEGMSIHPCNPTPICHWSVQETITVVTKQAVKVLSQI